MGNCKKLHVEGRYLKAGEEPFFWLGDTAWLMLQKLDEEEIKLYLKNRAGLGYNVIQAVLVHYVKDLDGLRDPTTSEYFDFCREIAEYADSLGIYLALLPSWGAIVGQGIINAENAGRYCDYIAERFGGLDNIVWVLGGDIRGDAVFDVVKIEGETLKRHDPDRLITYHPFGRTSSAMWFNGEDWLDLNMFQSGHRRYDQEILGEWDDKKVSTEEYFGEDNWRYVLRDLALRPQKPILDAEPSYERILQGLHNKKEPYWKDGDVRRYAYWSVLSGACGHTYGNNAIIQSYCEGELNGGFGVREGWQESMHAPGASQMRFLKDLMLEINWQTGRPADELLTYGQKERYHRICVFSGEGFIVCYDFCGDEFGLDLSEFGGRPLEVYWIDPQSGSRSLAHTGPLPKKAVFRPYRKDGEFNDWVLLIKG